MPLPALILGGMKLAPLLLIALLAACGVEGTDTILPASPAPDATPAPTPAPTSRPTTATATATKVQNLDASAAAKLLADNDSVVVLDVRTPAEFDAGHIDGAVNIDFQGTGFAAKLAELDRAVPYLVHCKSGGRSTKALEQFRKLGFATVYHLDGGFTAWQAAEKK